MLLSSLAGKTEEVVEKLAYTLLELFEAPQALERSREGIVKLTLLRTPEEEEKTAY